MALKDHLLIEAPPCSVTAYYNIQMMAPTPMAQTLAMYAVPEVQSTRKVLVHAYLMAANSQVTAKCEGLFVAVPPDHPAAKRW